jgi:uncharacterized protein (DUF2344 family)
LLIEIIIVVFLNIIINFFIKKSNQSLNQKIEKIIDVKKKLSESTIKNNKKVKTLRRSREKFLEKKK